jgi:hypothetical protein
MTAGHQNPEVGAKTTDARRLATKIAAKHQYARHQARMRAVAVTKPVSPIYSA